MVATIPMKVEGDLPTRFSCWGRIWESLCVPPILGSKYLHSLGRPVALDDGLSNPRWHLALQGYYKIVERFVIRNCFESRVLFWDWGSNMNRSQPGAIFYICHDILLYQRIVDLCTENPTAPHKKRWLTLSVGVETHTTMESWWKPLRDSPNGLPGHALFREAASANWDLRTICTEGLAAARSEPPSSNCLATWHWYKSRKP